MNDRRQFLTTLVSLGAVAAVPTTYAAARGSAQDLVPTKRSTAPNYWCTWAAQNYLYGQGDNDLDQSLLEGGGGARYAQTLLNERILFGAQGWSKNFHAKIRDELYLLLDDGWGAGDTASFQLDTTKFPSFPGAPQERLRGLNDAVRSDGWRALALWCRETPGGTGDDQRIGWCKFAGIPYLKVDGGDRSGSLGRARGSKQAPLTQDHINVEKPNNGDWRGDGRFGPQPWESPRLKILQNTDVYRAYDVTTVLGVPTTLDRAAELLRGASGHPEARALLNVEDEVYIAAVLGCTMGVMRHPYRGLRPGPDADVFLPRPRQLKQRMDEVVRAVRWQRIAPPFSAGSGVVVLDTNILTDDWIFRRGETFDSAVIGNRARQGAPARITRNMDLPVVHCDGEPPYVLCARFPGGAAAIGALERVSTEREVFHPRAHIRWTMGNATGPFGIFGHFGSLTLVFDRPINAGRILAQDLAGDTPQDITEQVVVKGSEIVLSGALIDRVGRSSATPGDVSMPGLLLAT